MSSEKVLIFDVGRVLIDFSFDPFERFLIKNGAKITTRDEFYDATNLFEYEKGAISSTDFINSVKNLLTTKVESDTIIKEWESIFSPNSEMIDFCSSFKDKVNTFILSNTNQIHWEHLDRTYNLRSLTKKAYTSFELGVMKPDDLIYKLAEEDIKIDSTNYLFIDDLEENVLSAKKLGWQVVHHKNISETKEIVNNFIRE